MIMNLEEVKAVCSENEAILVTDPYNMRYLSGFRGGEGMLYLSRRRCVLITDSRYTEAAEAESGFEVIEENAFHARTQILRELIQKDCPDMLSYENMSMRCAEFDSLKEKLSGVKAWNRLDRRLEKLREIKTDYEIDCLEKAESIGDKAFFELLGIIKPGMTELEAAAELEYRMKKNGARGLSFETIVASGPNSSMPHAMPSERKFRHGDFITMDFGCLYDGYCSDMTRTVVMGRADEKQRDIYETVQRAQTEALENLRPGMTGRDADRLARSVIEEAGYGKYFGHALGHSAGLYIHEEPRLSPRSEDILMPGMITTVEPGIYIPGFGGVRIEDMVLITEDGIRNLTSSPKELIEL